MSGHPYFDLLQGNINEASLLVTAAAEAFIDARMTGDLDMVTDTEDALYRTVLRLKQERPLGVGAGNPDSAPALPPPKAPPAAPVRRTARRAGS